MLCFLFLILEVAIAGGHHSPVEATASARADEARQEMVSSAEYFRLSEECLKLSTRNAWLGVERVYQQMEATGHALTMEDHVAGAHAARSTGDVTREYKRLGKAHRTSTENREILDWMWQIDQNYGGVFLATDLGENQLVPKKMPFNPNMQQAIRFAQSQIEESGVFEGLIPKGHYDFGSASLNVRPRVTAMRIEFRTEKRSKRVKKASKIKKTATATDTGKP